MYGLITIIFILLLHLFHSSSAQSTSIQVLSYFRVTLLERSAVKLMKKFVNRLELEMLLCSPPPYPYCQHLFLVVQDQSNAQSFYSEVIQ